MSQPLGDRETERRVLAALKEARCKLEEVERARSEPIAVIGMACRFPGGGSSPAAFWALLRDGRDGHGELPRDRWDLDAFFDPDPSAPGKMYVRHGHFLEGVDAFDPQAFGISPREARRMDPQQRLLLELSHEAIEHAGLAPRDLAAAPTGVFVGITSNDYGRVIAPGQDFGAIDSHHISGNHLNAAAGRIAYLLDLRGPALAVDTACSSSLVALHLACAALRAGECRQAFAAGVSLVLAPEIPIALCKSRMLAPDGRCKTFDRAADGFGVGEGAGVLLLKRLDDARRDGDRILALVRASAVNNDGTTSGFTVPSGPAQVAMIRAALAQARLSPDDIEHVEAHGTGTSLGDPIELQALGETFGGERRRDRPLLVGSVKTNIGHLAASAGIAGVIKTVLALQHREWPRHLHFEDPSPHVPWERLPLEVVREARGWSPGGAPRRAGVSSFGASGTNAHVILEEAPPLPLPEIQAPAPLPVVLSARDERALRELASSCARHLEAHPGLSLGQVARTTNEGRARHACRLALVVHDMAELGQRLADVGRGVPGAAAIRAASAAPPKVAFLFTEGAAYADMGGALHRSEPVFREAWDRCAAAFRAAGWSLEGQGSDLLALFALQHALGCLWLSWGVKPAAVLGEGVGEIAAACLAGLLPLEDGLRLCAACAGQAAWPASPRWVEPSIPFLSTRAGAPERRPPLDEASFRPAPGAPREIERALQSLRERGVDHVLQIGPDASILTLPGLAGRCLSSLRRGCDEREQILSALSELYLAGAEVDFPRLHAPWPAAKIDLPTTPFERRRFWVEDAPRAQAAASPRPPSGHPLLGVRLASPLPEAQYEARIRGAQPAFLADHRVFGAPVFPASAYLEMALSAAGDGPVVVEDVAFHRALLLAPTEEVVLQSVAAPHGEGGRVVRVFSQARDGGEPWRLHAEGHFRAFAEEGAPPAEDLSRLLAEHPRSRSIDEHYLRYDACGVTYGPAFRLVGELRAGPAGAIARIDAPSLLEDPRYRFHPAVLDACLQAIAAALPEDAAPTTYIPVRLERFVFRGAPRGALYSRARIDLEQPGIVRADVRILDAGGREIAALRGLQLKATAREAWLAQPGRARPSALEEHTYDLAWTPSPLSMRRADDLPGPDLLAAQVDVGRDEGAPSLSRYVRLLDALGDVAAAYVARALHALGGLSSDQAVPVAELLRRWPLDERYRPLARRLLAIACEAGLLAREGDRVRATGRGAPDPAALVRAARSEFPEHDNEIALVERCGAHLPGVLAGERDPLPLLFPDGDLGPLAALYADAPGSRYMNQLVAQAAGALAAASPPHRCLRVLEVGAGTGGTTAAVLPALSPERVSYTFTDVSPRFLMRAQELFGKKGLVRFETLDIERDPRAQGFSEHAFDVIIAANVLHATADARAAVAHVRGLLAPGGLLMLLESTAPRRWVDVTFGLTDGWWRFRDRDLRIDSPLLDAGSWSRLLQEEGFEACAVLRPRSPAVDRALEQSLLLTRAPSPAHRKAFLVVGGEPDAGPGLAEALRGQGHECAVIPAGSEGAIAKEGRAWDGVFAVFPPARAALEGGSAAEVADVAARRCAAALDAWRALSRRAPVPPLHLVTVGATEAAPGTLTDLPSATLWGLARTAQLERRDALVRCIDLDPRATPAEHAWQLLAEALSEHDEDQVAWRGAIRWGMRLRPHGTGAAAAPRRKGADGAYLVSGGLSGLGLRAASHLVDHGARHLVLIGRRGVTDEAVAPLAAWRGRGVRLDVIAGDVADEPRMRSLLEDLRRGGVRLRGVIHAAGALSDAALPQQDRSRVDAVFRAKVEGAWLLHQLTRADDLEYFVLFSSAASLLGSAGQANHAAANAFLDALARHRRGLGLPALSVAWGPWAEIGAAVDRDVSAHLSVKGVGLIPPSAGLEALDRLLAEGATHAAVVPIEWTAFRQAWYASPLFDECPRGSAARAAPREEAAPILERVRRAAPARRRELLRDHLRGAVASMLGWSDEEPLPVERGFFDLGMDSLTALELCNVIRRDLGVSVPETAIYRLPTVDALADHLAARIDAPHAAPTAVDAAPPAVDAAPAASPPSPGDLDDLDEEALMGLLRDELAAIREERAS